MNRETYEATLMDMVADLDEKDIDHFIDLVQSETKNPVTAFGLSLFLGLFGVDRFYIGDLGAGFLKLITLGGAGIWYLIDLFKIAGRTRDKSFAKVEVIFNQIYERRNRKKV